MSCQITALNPATVITRPARLIQSPASIFTGFSAVIFEKGRATVTVLPGATILGADRDLGAGAAPLARATSQPPSARRTAHMRVHAFGLPPSRREPGRHPPNHRPEPDHAESLIGPVRHVDAVIFAHGSDADSRHDAVQHIDYSGVANTLRALGDGRPRIVLQTTLFVTRKDNGLNAGAHALDWKCRSARLVRLSGAPYTIVRPGWLDNGPAGRHLTIEQGDTGKAASPARCPVRQPHLTGPGLTGSGGGGVLGLGQELTGQGFIVGGNQHANALQLQLRLLSSGIVCRHGRSQAVAAQHADDQFRLC